jgi:hypothetical protein
VKVPTGQACWQPEPSVARQGATRVAKRTQGVCRPCDRAPKQVNLRSRHCSISGRHYRSPSNSTTRIAVRRGRRAGHAGTGPSGTWEALSSPSRNSGTGEPRENLQENPPGRHLLRGGSKEAGARRYPRAKETKPEETAGRESERSIVPRKRGNSPLRTLPGKGSPCCRTSRRERWQEPRIRKPSPPDSGG